MKSLGKLLMVMIMFRSPPDASNDILVSIDQDKHGVEQILATGNQHSSINKRNAKPSEQFTTNLCKRSRVDTGTYLKVLDTGTYLKEKDISFWKDHGPLGLKLDKSPSFINSIQLKLSELAKKKAAQDSKMEHDKLKASNFGALHLRIGTWERLCKHEGDLIAKCYYAKKKIVWEILEGALKRKIEIQWSDIIGINAIIRDDEPGILEVELGNPPTYFLETNPQPRKHTLWQTASDFTGGQAPNYRRHLITFPPGILDKHYEKLLQCDQRLFNLSQKPFPTLSSPYFNSNNFCARSEHPCCDLNRNANEFPQMHQCRVQKFPIPSTHVHHVQNIEATNNRHPCYIADSITPGVVPQLPYVQNFGAPVGLPRHSQSLLTPTPHTDEGATENYMVESQRSVFLGQGTNISQGPSAMHILYQNFDGEESAISNTPTITSGLLFADDDADNQILLDHINSLIELEGMNPNTNNISANQFMSKHDQRLVSNHAINQNYEANGSRLMPKPLSWLSPQDMNATGAVIPSRNQSMYHYHVQEPTEQNVGTPNPSLIHHGDNLYGETGMASCELLNGDGNHELKVRYELFQ